MKTALDMLDRMEALCRKMAAQFTKENSNYHAIATGSSLAYIDTASYREAVAIVTELPEPVDEFEAAAKRYYDEWLHDGTTQPFAQDAMAYALRRAREEGVK